MSRSQLHLDDHLCFALYAANMAVNRAYKPALDSLGLTYPQYLVLLTLWERDCATIGAIAERLSLESSTITPLVKRLEAAGLLERQRNPEDERQVLVTLTAAGRAMQERATCIPEALLAQSRMTPAQLEDLNRHVRQLRAALVTE